MLRPYPITTNAYVEKRDKRYANSGITGRLRLCGSASLASGVRRSLGSSVPVGKRSFHLSNGLCEHLGLICLRV